VRKLLISIVVVMLSAGPALCAEGEVPWWKKTKIRFMWGCWGLASPDKSNPNWNERTVPREIIRDVALSGATVFADSWIYDEANARMAKELGLRYFATVHLAHLPTVPGGRAWVTESGEEDRRSAALNFSGCKPGDTIKCPLDESTYERWLIGPEKMAGIREGLIDGIHVDWEATEAGMCYCDDCFGTFLEGRGAKMDLPEKPGRLGWLKQQKLVEAYEQDYHQRRVAMFTSIREKAQAVNGDLLFSSYNVVCSDFTRAMNTPATPFVLLDARHYINDDRQPWWESYSIRVKQEGYLYIPGGWTNALFGSQPSQVSAAQWIYETSINEDGVWIWFEQPLTDSNLLAYAAADRRIRAVQRRTGRFLFDGEQDPNSVTVVEWTGRGDLEKAIVQRTYRLGDDFLAHLSNVDADWPLRARIRFPRLTAHERWTVNDAMGDLYYSRDGKSAVWTTAELRAGVVVTLEPRNDLFLRVSPARGDRKVARSALIYSREVADLPEHSDAVAHASPITDIVRIEGLYCDAALGTLLGSTKKEFQLSKTGWRFRMDQGDAGIAEEWFLPHSSLDGWTPIEIESHWADKGGTGAGWYRTDVDVPELPTDGRVYLHFGAVDEELTLWIDGRRAGDYKRGPAGWDQPFALDVTGKLTAGKRHLALRVYNSAYGGGVWKPVSVLTGPAVDTTGGGRLIYTATEPIIGLERPDHAGGGRISINTIGAVDGDGENQVRLRQLQGHLWSPSYSPDGGEFAFVHYARGRGQIFVANTDGSGASNISANAFCDRSPVWSPDGTVIAFLSDRTGDWDIYCMNAGGSEQRRVAGNPGLDRAPDWSPDSERIAWESHVSGTPGVWVCNADGSNSRPLIGSKKPVKMERMETGENNVFNVTETAWPFRDNTFYMVDPKWSPDGTRIAARCLGAQSGDSVVVVDAEGRHVRRLIAWIGGIGEVIWSPDGTHLAGPLRTAPQETERSGLFIVKADGTDAYRWLVDVTPQGPKLGGASRIGVMTWYSHGSARPRRIVKSFCSLAWSPDGKAIAFTSDMDPVGAYYVYTIDPDGGQPKRLDGTSSAWPNEIAWRPQ